MQTVTQSDINACARGLGLVGKSPAELRHIIAEFCNKPEFSARVITAAAKQMFAAKRRVGAL